MSSLRKNVASQNITFSMLSATTGAVDASATVTVYVTKDNGSQATGTGTVTNSGHGQYNYAPTQAETNATDVGFLFTASGDIAVNYDFHTDIVDANGLASVNAADVGGTAQTGRDLGATLGVAGAGLTALGDTRIANLDAAVSTRSTYAGADTSGTTTLLGRLTAARAGYIDALNTGVTLAASQPGLTFISLTVTGELHVGDGLVLMASSTGKDALYAQGNGMGVGANFNGGGGDAVGVKITGTANAPGLEIFGSGNQAGIATYGGGSDGTGMQITGGGTNGAGLQVQGQGNGNGAVFQAGSTGGTAAVFQGGDTGDGMDIIGGANNPSGQAGLYIGSGGDAPAMWIDSGASTADGLLVSKGSAGVDIRGSITGDLNGGVTGVINALTVTANAEPGAVPAANATLATKIAWVYAMMRNKLTQTASAMTLRNGGDSGNIGTAATSDDGSTATRGPFT